VIILLTDRVNNAGFIEPKRRNVAKQYGIKVYTIGMGQTVWQNFHTRWVQTVNFIDES
jgi:hypothetical protein